MKTKEQKRQEAEARHAARASRTPDQQLALLRSRGITSGAEFDRLYAAVESGAGKLTGNETDKPVIEEVMQTHRERKAGKKKGAKHA